MKDWVPTDTKKFSTLRSVGGLSNFMPVGLPWIQKPIGVDGHDTRVSGVRYIGCLPGCSPMGWLCRDVYSPTTIMKKNSSFTVGRKDLEVTWFSGTGSGGQYRNKHANCCRIRHPETGVIVTGQSQRSQEANKREALGNLVNHWKFRAFLKQRLDEVERGVTLREKCEAIVDELMNPEHISEVHSEKDWKLLTRGKKKEVVDGVEVWMP